MFFEKESTPGPTNNKYKLKHQHKQCKLPIKIIHRQTLYSNTNNLPPELL